ncbi:MAG: dUTP diphosphatase [Bacteroidetes bacterium]|nr:dUTP diphosphatase [Bacteroidota bacterium]
MPVLSIKIVNRSSNPIPSYATEAAAGMDIRAALPNPVQLAPGERRLIPTGLFIELPIGYEAQVRPRSGLALKQGITCLNAPGTIDADYRGEIGVILINHSNETQVIQPGDRIAQLVVQPVVSCSWIFVSELPDSTRGQGGFGHTGLK